MNDRLVRTAADMVALFVARAAELGFSHREVDEIAGLGDGYFSKVACGDRKPGALTIERICGALGLAFVPFAIGAAQEGVGVGSKSADSAPRCTTSRVDRTDRC
jgi:hypothetical protein